jgi:hypothetical protein
MSYKTLLAGIVISTTMLAMSCKKTGPEGVAECDEYFKLVEQCAGPAADAIKESLKQNKEAWKEVDQESLKQACGTARDAMKNNPGCKK